jgi:hypothetical protein
VREAAEATKVRTDFLTHFENNHFDFDMPEVYKRGFLRLYARFLKLDVDKVLTDYQAVILGSSKHAKRESKEFFGRMDLPESESPLGAELAEPPPPVQVAALQSEHPQPRPVAGAPANAMDLETDHTLYWKIGLPIGGTLLIAMLAVLIGIWVTDGEGDGADTVNTAPVGAVADANDGTSMNHDVPNVAENTSPMVITSRGDTRLWVRQENDSRILYDQIIRAGEKISLERKGPVRVVSSDFQYLTINVNGQVYHSQAEGVGQNIFY